MASTDVACERTPRLRFGTFNLSGKTALLTGGTRGIGQACAVALAEAGASVILAVRPGTAPGADGNHPALSPCLLFPTRLPRRSTRPSKPTSPTFPPSNLSSTALCPLPFRRHRHPRQLWRHPTPSPVHRLPRIRLGRSSQRQPQIRLASLPSCWSPHDPPRSGKIINFGSLLTFQGGLTVPAYASAKGAVGNSRRHLATNGQNTTFKSTELLPATSRPT